MKNGGEEGIRTLARLAPSSGFRNRPLQPLGYFSSLKHYIIKMLTVNYHRYFDFYIVKSDHIKYNNQVWIGGISKI